MPLVVAHRGYSAVAPENTLAAVTAAARAGADLIEVDVRTGADGTPHVVHDPTVDRTTGGVGAVATHDRDAAGALDAGAWFAPAYAGQRLPTLAAVLAEVARSPAGLLLEVKPRQTAAQVARIVQEVRAAGLIARTILQSFGEAELRAARRADPELRLALLRRALDPEPVAAARALGVMSYNPDWRALEGRPDVVAALRSAGVAVIPYTVDDPAGWAAMAEHGVDGIITNTPGALVGWNAAMRQVARRERLVAA